MVKGKLRKQIENFLNDPFGEQATQIITLFEYSPEMGEEYIAYNIQNKDEIYRDPSEKKLNKEGLLEDILKELKGKDYFIIEEKDYRRMGHYLLINTEIPQQRLVGELIQVIFPSLMVDKEIIEFKTPAENIFYIPTNITPYTWDSGKEYIIKFKRVGEYSEEIREFFEEEEEEELEEIKGDIIMELSNILKKNYLLEKIIIKNISRQYLFI